ncbi:MAG: hypothetical protein JWQ48_2695 [Conexibacter sp.]|jgi:hypothetical protein|nr:hypothetical protein [Conexibacter sp.]
MPTRVAFANGQVIVVPESEDEVVLAVRRDYPNPVALVSSLGGHLHVNWDHVTLLEEERPVVPR